MAEADLSKDVNALKKALGAVNKFGSLINLSPTLTALRTDCDARELLKIRRQSDRDRMC